MLRPGAVVEISTGGPGGIKEVQVTQPDSGRISSGSSSKKEPCGLSYMLLDCEVQSMGEEETGVEGMGGARAQRVPCGFLRACTPYAQTCVMKDSCSSCRIPIGSCPLVIIRAIVCFITVCLLCSMRAETLSVLFIAVSPVLGTW